MKYIKLILFLGLAAFLVYNTFVKIRPSLSGDGIEYILMTESFYNHGTPDLRTNDILSFKDDYSKENQWIGFPKVWADSQLNFVQNSFSPMDLGWGYGTAMNKKKYCQHFWLYSFINLPVKAVMELIHKNPLRTFQITNTLIVLLVVFYLLFIAGLEDIKRIILVVSFVFSSVFWYLIWPHPEVFAAACVLMSLVLYFEKKFYWAIFIAALATTHNPPIILVVLFIAGKCLIEKGFNLKNLSLMFVSGLFCAIPTLFYYYNFHVPNLIIEAGFLNTKYYTFTRFFGFFFDLNQGLILSIPLIMLLFMILYFSRLFSRIKKYNYNLLLLPVIIGMTLLSMTMGNWNMGEVIIIRYAVWVSMVIVAYTVLTMSMEKVYQKIVIIIAVLVQPYVVWLYGGMEIDGNFYVSHYPMANWVLTNHPAWYNPDPEIFGERTLNMDGFSEKDSIVAFKTAEGKITKLMVHRSALKTIGADLISHVDTTKLKFINNWTYINY